MSDYDDKVRRVAPGVSSCDEEPHASSRLEVEAVGDRIARPGTTTGVRSQDSQYRLPGTDAWVDFPNARFTIRRTISVTDQGLPTEQWWLTTTKQGPGATASALIRMCNSRAEYLASL